MHIVFLIHAFPVKGKHTGGGAGNYVANMARILCRNGHRVTIITEADDKDIFTWEGIEVRHIRATRFFKDTGRRMTTVQKVLKNLWRSIWYNYEVCKINMKDPIDLVQGISSFNISLLRCRSIPYLIRISEYPVLVRAAVREEYHYKQAISEEELDDKFFFMALKRADMLVAPSLQMKTMIFNRIGREVSVIESPVMLSDYTGNVKTPEKKYFLTFGFLTYRRSTHVLAQIIDRLLDDYTDMEYVFVGKDREVMREGKYIWCSQLVKSIVIKNRERLIFRGEIFNRDELFSVIKNSSLCILPSRVDNLSNACLESMALGKIVVGSDQTSAEQVITDGYNGFLAPIDDAEALYQKIRQAMELSDDEKKVMENRAKERVKDLTPDKVYEKMMDAYTKTIERFNERNMK